MFRPLGTIDSPAMRPRHRRWRNHQLTSICFPSAFEAAARASNLQQMLALFGDGPLPASPLTALCGMVAVLSSDPRGCSPLPGSSAHGAIMPD